MKFLVLLFLYVTVRVSINYFSLRKLETLKEKYIIFISSLTGEDINNEFNESFFELEPEIVQLFVKSGITRPTYIHLEPLGYMRVSEGKVDVWDNMFVNNSNIARLTIGSFHSAIGVYKLRLKKSLNPFTYIEEIVYLPQTIFKYFGADKDSSGVKLLNLIYWFLTVFYTIYSDSINRIIQDLLSNSFK